MAIINWTPCGDAEYEMSWRLRPRHLADLSLRLSLTP